MNKRLLGRTNLNVSEIGFGCWAIGGSGYGSTRDEESLQALETAWNTGVNFFDTADTYGHGHSEALLAKFLKNKSREEFIIASKVGWDFYDPPSKKNFDPPYIRNACEQTLKRLDLETVDIYQLHNPKLDILNQGDAVGALEQLKEQGKIRFIGVSVHTQDEAMACIEDGRVDTLQLVFNMLNQQMSQDVFETAKKNGVGIIVREPLAFGFLTGKYAADHEFEKEDHRRRFTKDTIEANLKKIEAYRKILSTERLSFAQAAIEYVLQFDAVSTVIPGMKTKVQVEENLKASEEPLLRAQEIHLLREMYYRDDVFRGVNF